MGLEGDRINETINEVIKSGNLPIAFALNKWLQHNYKYNDFMRKWNYYFEYVKTVYIRNDNIGIFEYQFIAPTKCRQKSIKDGNVYEIIYCIGESIFVFDSVVKNLSGGINQVYYLINRDIIIWIENPNNLKAIY